MRADLNRLKVVLAEKKKTSKWLAGQLGKDPANAPSTKDCPTGGSVCPKEQ